MEHPRKKQKTETSELLEKYESLKASFRDQNSEAHKGEATQLVIHNLNKLKEIYGIIQNEHNRDTRVQLKDSEILLDASKFAATNAQNIKLGDLGVALSSDDVLSKIKKYMNPYAEDSYNGNDSGDIESGEPFFNSFNWAKLGSLYLQVSSKPIFNGFLYGPLETERKKINARTRVLDDTQSNGVVTTAKNVQATDIESNQEQNTAHMVKNVYRKFIENQDEEDEDNEDEGVNFFKFFINPNSFGQSVENLFFTSFLIKDAKLKLTMDEEGTPILQGVDPDELDGEDDEDENEEEETKTHNTNHFIATFTYDAWKELIRKYNITETYLGNRPEPEDTFDEDDV